MRNFIFHFALLVLLAGCLPTSVLPLTPTSLPSPIPSQSLSPPAIPSPVVLTPTDTSSPQPEEVRVQPLELTGFAAESGSQFSSLAWYQDWLILLPQYPRRFRDPDDDASDGSLLAIPKQRILDYLDGIDSEDLEPTRIPFFSSGLIDEMKGYEGFESLVFLGDRAFLTAEANLGSKMVSYLVEGRIDPDLTSFHLEPGGFNTIEVPADLSNMSYESSLIYQDHLILMYEANGVNVNPQAQAPRFTLDFQPEAALAFPQIEYRITDVTQPDSRGVFWAINYFFTGDQKLEPGEDLLAGRWGEGVTHTRLDTVERLVAFQISPEGIQLADRPPIQLELIDDDHARNWEGIVRLDDLGFILVTDTFPQTLLGFVPAQAIP